MRKTWVKPLRTAVQCLLGLLPAMPILVPALGLNVTAGLGATLLLIAATACRIMQIPQVEEILSRFNLHSQ